MKTLISALLFSNFTLPMAMALNSSDELDRLKVGLSRIDENARPASCQNRYEKIFKDGELNIVVGFGYSENAYPADEVYDRHFHHAFRRAILQPCTEGVFACGFKPSTKVNEFVKKIRLKNGKEQRVIINTVVGSLSKSQAFNTSPENYPKQRALCSQAMDRFMNLVSQGSEVVLYTGHSRDGGAPSFCPPVLKESKKVDYSWYHQNPIGFNRLVGSVQAAVSNNKAPQILGMYSCYSKKHFYKRYLEVSPSTGYLLANTSPLLDENFYFLFSTVDSLLGERCEEGLREAMGLYNQYPHIKILKAL